MDRSEFRDSLSNVLDRAIEADDAALGNVQRLVPGRARLEIVSHRGFAEPFLRVFKFVSAEDESACGRAFRRKSRVSIPDVLTDPLFAPYAEVADEAGFRAVQSTPIVSHHGHVLGVLSTHFSKPHRVSRAARRRLDTCAREAAAIMVAYDHGRRIAPNPDGIRHLVGQLVERLNRDAEATFTDDERLLLWRYVRLAQALTDDEAKLVRRCAGAPWLRLG